jgi:hypothetical protein
MYDPASDEPKPERKPRARLLSLMLGAAGTLLLVAGIALERRFRGQRGAAGQPISVPATVRSVPEGSASSSNDRILTLQGTDVQLPPGPDPFAPEEHRSASAGETYRFSVGREDWEFVVPEGFKPGTPDWGEGAGARRWNHSDGWTREGPRGEVRLRLNAYYTEFLCKPYSPREGSLETGRQAGYPTLSYESEGQPLRTGFFLSINKGTCIQLTLYAKDAAASQEAASAFLAAQRSLYPSKEGSPVEKDVSKPVAPLLR